MFSEGGIVMVLGILLGLGVIGGSVYYINKMFANNTQEILVRFILLIFTSLVALFIVDKVIAWQVKLLSEEQNGQLFDLIKTLVLMIFSYYFGTKEGVETNDEVTSDLKVFVKSLKYCVLYPYIGKGFEEDTCGVKAFDEVYCNPRIQGLGLLSK